MREPLGSGGVGAVHRATHETTGQVVALKVVKPELARVEEVLRRLEREARALSAIDSPHVVRVVEFGGRADPPFLAMELLEGRDLGAVLASSDRAMPTARAVRIARETLLGLEAAHRAGVLHRDLKPENVFLVREGTPRERVKVVDFGMSKLAHEEGRERFATARGIVIGTPSYLSPEQARGDALDARADVYSVGALLFECLAGRPPHVGPTPESVLVSILESDAPDVRELAPRVDARIAAVIARALARKPEDRFASARAMADALAPPNRSQARIVVWAFLAVVLGLLLTLAWLAR